MSNDDPQVQRLVSDLVARRIDRRQFVRLAVTLGLSLPTVSALLAACTPQAPATAGAPSGSESGAPSASPSSTSAAVPERLTLRLSSDIANLDPAFYPASTDESVFTNIFEGLVAWKPGTFDVVNQLAAAFEPSADGLSYEFTLKEGLLWQKGYGEVTAEDVKFSYERIAGLTTPKIESPYTGDWSPHLKEVTVKDNLSGTIVLNEPFAPLMRSTLPTMSGAILPRKAVEERGESFATDPVGSGPYEFVSWTPKERVVLKRFAEYSGAFAEHHGSAFPEIHFLPIDNDSAANIGLETGETDFGLLGVADIERFEANDAFAVKTAPTLDYGWIGMNQQHPKLTDLRVRQAIRLAIDVPAIIDAAFEGRFQRARAIIPENMGIGYWADAPEYAQDVDAAKALLQQAGLSNLDLTFTYAEETGSAVIAQVVQENLAELGITVTLNLVDSAAFYTLGKSLRERELYYVGFVTQPDPSWSFVWFTCSQIDVWNWQYWCDEEFDMLHFAAIKEPDPAKRSEMYIEMQKLWDAAANVVWTHYPTNYFGHRTGIEPAITPHGRFLPHAFRAV
jgi:peptide/nickel transport system substrate-binding protein